MSACFSDTYSSKELEICKKKSWWTGRKKVTAVALIKSYELPSLCATDIIMNHWYFFPVQQLYRVLRRLEYTSKPNPLPAQNQQHNKQRRQKNKNNPADRWRRGPSSDVCNWICCVHTVNGGRSSYFSLNRTRPARHARRIGRRVTTLFQTENQSVLSRSTFCIFFLQVRDTRTLNLREH